MKKALIIIDGSFKLNGTSVAVMNFYPVIRKEFNVDFLIFSRDNTDYHSSYVNEIKKNDGNVYFIQESKLFDNYREARAFFNCRRYDVYHLNCSRYKTFLIFLLSLNNKNSVVISHTHTNGTSNNIIYKIIVDFFVKPIINMKSDKLLACSQQAGDQKFGKFYFKRKGCVLKNGINVNDFFYSKEYIHKIKSEAGLLNFFVIGTVGRLSYEKNQKFLIDVLNELKTSSFRGRFKLLIVGGGGEYANLLSYTKDLDLVDDVVFAGERSDIPRQLAAMDLFLFPSLFEGFGIAALEAQASGIPVVCSNGVSLDVNVSGMCHFMPENADPHDWAQYILDSIDTFSRYDARSKIIDAGYDKSSNSGILVKLYRGNNG